MPHFSLRALAFLFFAGAVAWLWLSADSQPSDARRFFGLWRTWQLLAAAALLWLGVASLVSSYARGVAKLLFATASGLFTLLLVEAFGLSGVVDYTRLVEDARPALGAVAEANLDLRGESVADLAYRWGLPSEPVAFHYRTDHRGFRNEPDREEADYYLLGDSFLVSGLLPFEETLAARLETRLERPVMNLALMGLSPAAEARLLAESGVPLAGNTVLHFIFEGNDLADARREAEQAGGSAQRFDLDRLLTYQLLLRLQRLSSPEEPEPRGRVCDLNGERVGFLWDARSMRCEACEAQLPSVLATLSQLRRDVEAAGGRYAVVLIPDKLRVLGPYCRWEEGALLADSPSQLSTLPSALAEWAAQESVAFLDLTPALDRSAAGGAIPWAAWDTHWNAVGSRVAARAIDAWLGKAERAVPASR